VNAKITRGDEQLDVDQVFVTHMRDGKVAETWLTANDPFALEGFWR
jgi:hypothetical protein